MPEFEPKQSGDEEIRTLLQARLEQARIERASSVAEELATEQERSAEGEVNSANTNGVVAEDTGAEAPVCVEESSGIEADMRRIREIQEQAEAERQDLLDKAAEKAEQLRDEAAKLDRQREAELAAEAERQRLVVEAEIERRQLEAAAERQRAEEAERLAVAAQAAQQEALAQEAAAILLEREAEVERRRIAAAEAQELEEQQSLRPKTLEYPVVSAHANTDPKVGTETEIEAEAVDVTDVKRKRWPRVLAIASCVSIVIAGGTIASGHDRGISDRIAGLVDDIRPTETAKVKPFTATMPRAIITPAKPIIEATPKTEKKKADNKPKETERAETLPAVQPSTTPTPATPNASRLPKPAAKTPAAKPKPTAQSELTDEQKNPGNYTSNSESTGAASYGDTQTKEGGAAPYVQKVPAGR